MKPAPSHEREFCSMLRKSQRTRSQVPNLKVILTALMKMMAGTGVYSMELGSSFKFEGEQHGQYALQDLIEFPLACKRFGQPGNSHMRQT